MVDHIDNIFTGFGRARMEVFIIQQKGSHLWGNISVLLVLHASWPVFWSSRNMKSFFVRLPTEAEWEYAARGWTSTRFSYGDDPGYTDLANYAWYADSSGGTTRPVGQLLPNPWALYDMAGNVWEWCQDRWAPLPGGTALDPQRPATGANRVIRGGSWAGPVIDTAPFRW